MLREVIVDDQKYEIDTTPVLPNGSFHYSLATIYGVLESPASGVIANFLRDLGKKPVIKTRVEIDEAEKKKVVVALGWKYSRSNAWRNLWELYGRERK